MTAPRLKVIPSSLERFRSAPRGGLKFGLPSLDALLPHGVPRGHITELDAPLGSGGTALLLALADVTLRGDEAVALVDAQRTLAPQAAAHLAQTGAFWVVRPRGTESAWWCADVLLRTGAFGLVIVDLAPSPASRIALRLQRLARDKDAALVFREMMRRSVDLAVGNDGEAFRSVRPPGRLTAPSYRPALRLGVRGHPAGGSLQVTIEKDGAPRVVEVSHAAPLPHRLRPHWAVRDRSGDRPGKRRGGIGGRGQRPRAGTPQWPHC